MTVPLVVLGCGFTGTAAARLALSEGRTVVAVARSTASLADARAFGADARVIPSLTAAAMADLPLDGADVLVCFPPDGVTDEAIAPTISRARAVVYISTTGVYGDTRGAIDHTTPIAPTTASAALRVQAESHWRAQGATVLRAAGIYGPFRGLHRRLARGDFRIPGDGSNVVSRIHADDLARLCVAACAKRLGPVSHPVADACPVPQREVIEWICHTLKLPVPPCVPLDQVHETLRHDRSIDGRALRAALSVELAFPSYREGYLNCWEVERRSS